MSADDLTTVPQPAPATAARTGTSPLAKFAIGAAIVVTKTTDSESGREYTVEAKATILK